MVLGPICDFAPIKKSPEESIKQPKPMKVCCPSSTLPPPPIILTKLPILALSPINKVEGWTSVMVSMWFLGGLMISIIGLVGYYVGLSFNETKKRPIYIVSETTGDNFKE